MSIRQFLSFFQPHLTQAAMHPSKNSGKLDEKYITEISVDMNRVCSLRSLVNSRKSSLDFLMWYEFLPFLMSETNLLAAVASLGIDYENQCIWILYPLMKHSKRVVWGGVILKHLERC